MPTFTSQRQMVPRVTTFTAQSVESDLSVSSTFNFSVQINSGAPCDSQTILRVHLQAQESTNFAWPPSSSIHDHLILRVFSSSSNYSTKLRSAAAVLLSGVTATRCLRVPSDSDNSRRNWTYMYDLLQRSKNCICPTREYITLGAKSDSFFK